MRLVRGPVLKLLLAGCGIRIALEVVPQTSFGHNWSSCKASSLSRRIGVTCIWALVTMTLATFVVWVSNCNWVILISMAIGLGNGLHSLTTLLMNLAIRDLEAVRVKAAQVTSCSCLLGMQLRGRRVPSGSLTWILGTLLLRLLCMVVSVLLITCMHRLKLTPVTRLDRLLFSRPFVLWTLRLPTVIVTLELRLARVVTALNWLRVARANGPLGGHRKHVQVCL